MTRDARLGPATAALLTATMQTAEPVNGGGTKGPARRPRPKSADDPSLDADLRDHLGAQLRAMFQEIVTEPLPNRFQSLLDALDQEGSPADEQR